MSTQAIAGGIANQEASDILAQIDVLMPEHGTVNEAIAAYERGRREFDRLMAERGFQPSEYWISTGYPDGVDRPRRRFIAHRVHTTPPPETPATRAEAFNAWAQVGDPHADQRMVIARQQYEALLRDASRGSLWRQQQAMPATGTFGGRIRFAPAQEGAQVVKPKAPEEVQEDVKTMKLANRFKVGCDPEFAMLDRTGRLVTVNDYNLTLDSPVGVDHNGRVVELRPTPARSAYTLLRRMKKLLDSEVLEPYKSHRWKAGAIAQRQPRLTTLGGHVHLDTLNPVKEFGQYDTERHQALIDALDRYTVNLERLDILPRAEDVERRNSGNGYGMLGDWRTAPGSELDGQQHHMEYRTMSSWLFDPRVAMLCIAGAKFAALDSKLVMDKLPRLGASYTKLKEYFEAFRGKDEDADRVLDKILHVPISKLHADVTADFKKKWSVLPC